MIKVDAIRTEAEMFRQKALDVEKEIQALRAQQTELRSQAKQKDEEVVCGQRLMF